ncbi:hypothetical protein [Methylocystis sp.]|uniref:hypothetical protein n=1 Tax=Methylocystis sp. TaxID=1911079 RepID=UPI00345BF578
MSALQRLSARGRQMLRRHLGTESRAPQEQLGLPLDYSQSERSGLSQNCGSLKARPSRLSQDRLEKYREIRELRGTVLASCDRDSAKAQNRQGERKTLLTPKC